MSELYSRSNIDHFPFMEVSMSQKFRWGILSTGNIAKTFARGLTSIDDAELVAVGSRTRESADRFGDEYSVPHRHSTYEDLARDPDVDAIYVATPHPMHHDNAILCLEHDKPVLVEKPFTVNASEAKRVIETARSRGVFCMEAMWTRFLPVIAKLREIVESGEIGDVRMVQANFAFRAQFNPESRLFKPELGGGGLLDVGIYAISFARMIMKNAPVEVYSMADMGKTGVDEQAAIILRYGAERMAMLMCGTRVTTKHDACVYGTDGYAIVHHPFWHGTKLTVKKGDDEQTLEIPYDGNGYTHEAREVMTCVRAGKLESDVMPLDETHSIMKTLDWVRSQWNLEYPWE
jgi:predicted dehydrogenase